MRTWAKTERGPTKRRGDEEWERECDLNTIAAESGLDGAGGGIAEEHQRDPLAFPDCAENLAQAGAPLFEARLREILGFRAASAAGGLGVGLSTPCFSNWKLGKAFV